MRLVWGFDAGVTRSIKYVFGAPYLFLVTALFRISEMQYASIVCCWRLLYVLLAKALVHGFEAVAK